MSIILGRRPIQDKDKLFYMCEITKMELDGKPFAYIYFTAPSAINKIGFPDYETCLQEYFKFLVGSEQPITLDPIMTQIFPAPIDDPNAVATHMYIFFKKIIFVNSNTPNEAIVTELMRDHDGIIF